MNSNDIQNRPRKLRLQKNQRGYSVYSLSVPPQIGDLFDVNSDKFLCHLAKDNSIVFVPEGLVADPEEEQEEQAPEEEQALEESQSEDPTKEESDDIWSFGDDQEETPESVFGSEQEDVPDDSIFEGW